MSGRFAEIMSPLLNMGQPARRAVLTPGGIYSRVVSCMGLAFSGVPDWAITHPVGQRVWLLGIRLWHRHAGPTSNAYTSVRFFTGTTAIRTAAEILEWEEILPVSGYGDDLVFWRLYDEWPSMAWSMRQLFSGEGRRFGVRAVRSAAALSDEYYVSFEVSEG